MQKALLPGSHQALAEGLDRVVWRTIRDDFLDFIRSEECAELARSIA